MKQQDASAGGRGIEGELLESHKCILGYVEDFTPLCVTLPPPHPLLLPGRVYFICLRNIRLLFLFFSFTSLFVASLLLPLAASIFHYSSLDLINFWRSPSISYQVLTRLCFHSCNRSAITFNGFCCQCFPRSAPNLNKTKEEEKDNDESGHGNKLLALTSSAIVTFVNETGGAARSDAERCAQKTLEWVEDTDASICADCGATIQASTMMGVTLKTNKHHCRRCGQVFCGACTSHRLIISTLSASPVRVCNSCYDRTLLERTVTPEDIDLLVTGKGNFSR